MNREARRQAAKQRAGSGAAPQSEAAHLLALAGEGTDAPLGVTTIAVREASGIYR